MTTKSGINIKCSIPGCKTVFGNDKNIKFHKIRKSVAESEKEKRIWMKALPFLTKEDFASSKYRICGRHFRHEDYIYRPLRHFKREKDLKSNAIPTLNLPKIQLHETEIEVLNIEYDSSHNYSTIIKCDCGKRTKTKSVGTQCDNIPTFSKNCLFNENYESIEKYISHQRYKEKASDENLTSEEELLAEINGQFFCIEAQKEQTCDLPSDDFFFNEISKINSKITDLGFHCCEQCGLTFTDFRSYRDHEGVHAEISLLCCYCGEISTDYVKNIEHEYRCRKIKQIENGEIIPRKKRKRSKKTPNEYSQFESSLDQIPNYLDAKEQEVDSNIVESKTGHLVGYFCSVCQKIFESEEFCQEHLKQHFLEKNVCETNEIIESSIDINKEYKISDDTTIEFLKNPNEGYPCPTCDRIYGTKYLLNRHIDVKHLNPIQKSPTFQCNECDMTFRNLPKLQSHIKEHVISLKHCKICNVIHDDNQKYLKHLEIPQHLLSEEKWKNRYNINFFSCSLCKTKQTEYNELADLAKHSEYHRISKTRIFINTLLAEHEINYLKP